VAASRGTDGVTKMFLPIVALSFGLALVP